MNLLFSVSSFLSVLLPALITGFFYGYACSVNSGLGALQANEYLRAMQSINKAVLNPVFFASFIGTLFILPLHCWVLYQQGHQTGFYFLLAAAIIYAVGVFGITAMVNVPLNNAIASLNITAMSKEAIESARSAFEKKWNLFNLVRTIASLLVLTLVIIAVMMKNK